MNDPNAMSASPDMGAPDPSQQDPNAQGDQGGDPVVDALNKVIQDAQDALTAYQGEEQTEPGEEGAATSEGPGGAPGGSAMGLPDALSKFHSQGAKRRM